MTRHLYMPPTTLLAEHVILITGASRGIGRAAARAFAAHGATVILLARTLKQLEDVYDEIKNAGHPEPAIYPFNLITACPKDYDDLRNTLETHFGRLDGVLHNAALLGSLTPIEHYPIEQWYSVFQVNLNSAFLLTQATLPLLKASSNASILFTSAPPKTFQKAYWGAYGASKLGCEGLMKILADELETNTNIRVNSIHPNRIQTGLRASAYPTEDADHLLTPEEIMPLYLYLMGKDSIGVTGQSFDPVSFGLAPVERLETATV